MQRLRHKPLYDLRDEEFLLLEEGVNDGLLHYDIDVSDGVRTFRTQLEQLLTAPSSAYLPFQKQAVQTCCTQLEQITVDYLKEVAAVAGCDR